MPFDQYSVATQIKESVAALLAARESVNGKPTSHAEVTDRFWFADLDKNWGTSGAAGLVSSLQGLHTVFNALSALEGHEVDVWQALSRAGAKEDEAHEVFGSLIDEWLFCLEEIERGGYVADPYDPSSQLSQMFQKSQRQPSYTDTVAWALSTSVLVNYVLTRTRAAELAKYPNLDQIVHRTRDHLQRSFGELLAAQTGDGGWGWSRQSETGHLIFTWSAVGSLADFCDYVLGESEKEIGIGPDHKMIEFISSAHPDLEQEVKAVKLKAASFLSNQYLSICNERDMTAADMQDKEISVILKHELALFYCDLYLLEALVLLGYQDSQGEVGEIHRSELESLYGQIVAKLQRVKETSFANDPEASTLTFVIQDPTTIDTRNHLKWTSKDGGLWPQLLRSLVLYRFYVLRDLTDPWIAGDKGSSALRLLLDQKRPPVGDYPNVWDLQCFNLNITARAISGLVDAYDYFDLQDKLNPKTEAILQTTDGLAPILAETLYPFIERLILDSFERGALARVTDARDHSSEPAARLQPMDSQLSSMRRELEVTVKTGIGPGILSSVGDCAATELLPTRGMMNPNWVADQVLGGKWKADKIKNDPATQSTYDLLAMLSWISFSVSVKLLPSILQEAVLERLDPKAQEAVRSKVGDDNSLSLAGRIHDALRALSKLESEAADGQEEDRPSYEKAIGALLSDAQKRTEVTGKAGKRS